jgi:hypothetical protein
MRRPRRYGWNIALPLAKLAGSSPVSVQLFTDLVTLMVDLVSNQCYNRIQGQLNVL